MLKDNEEYRKNIIYKKAYKWINDSLRKENASSNAILINSIPKSGTHLLSQILKGNDYGGFIATTPSISMRKQSDEVIIKKLGKLYNNEVMRSHIFYSYRISSYLIKKNIAPFFIYRDPRAIFISEIFYLDKINKWHACSKYYTKCINFDEKFQICLNGINDKKIYYPSFAERIENYIGWYNDPNVCSVKFENLISKETRNEEIKKIKHFLKENKKDWDKSEIKLGSIKPEKSHTYTGKAPNRWETMLNVKQIDKLNDSLESVLSRLNYV